MLRVGLTGGIGSGKSTVAQRFRELGAVVIDADRLAREVVAVGSPGLAAIRERFGNAVAAADGSLDRAALGEIVFSDAQARRDLEAITHPLIAARTRTLVDAATTDQIVVHDVPLLVELDLAADYHLTMVVGADEGIRVARLTADRGFTPDEARARIGAQAGDSARRAAADAWLDNNGTVNTLVAQVEALWRDRLLGFNDNLRTGSRSPRTKTLALVPYDDAWPSAASRLIARITVSLRRAGLAEPAMDVTHIGSTSVPGLLAKDVIDLQIGVPRLADADAPEFVKVLAGIGFPRSEGNNHDTAHGWAPHRASWAKRFHGSSDPGRVAHVHVREHGSAGWEAALLFRDWLAANGAERDEYADLKVSLARVQEDSQSTGTATDDYTLAKEPWIDSALERARIWARHTGWSPTGGASAR
jgi:dephospho-CoA kinase